MKLTLPSITGWFGAKDEPGVRGSARASSNSGSLKGISGIEQRSRMMEYDQPLVWVVLLLMLFGMVMVYSASIALPDSPKYANYKTAHFLIRQAMFIGVSLVVGLMVFRIKIETWQKLAPYLFVVTLILLAMVLVPGLGRGVNGAKRWLSFRVFNLQPSELMKLFIEIGRAHV